MKAMLRRKRCVIASWLSLVLGGVLLIFVTYPGKTIKYGNLSLSSHSIAGSFQFGLNVDDEPVMLLIPKYDESRLLQPVHAELAPSQSGTKSEQFHMEKTLSNQVFKLMNAKVSSDNDRKAFSLLDSKKPTQHVGVMASLARDLDISTDELAADYLHVVNPVIDSTKHAPQNRKINVLIITNRRSGSSFLGQFFNQHPSLFFQFEPLKLTEWKKESYPDRDEYLHHLVKCEFDQTPYLTEFYDSEPLHRSSSIAMISPPLCNVPFSAPITIKTVTECQNLETKPLMQVCHNKQYQAIKLIRLYSISSLQKLALDSEINLKIIHLVRDPRGTHVSKSKIRGANVSLKLGESMDHDISYLCRRISRNLDFVRTRPPWLQGKYKLVRFEDIAKQPLKLAQELYDFTGMGPIPQEVLNWIHKNTKVQERNRDSNDVHYSTSRNTSQVSEAWRYEMPLQVVLRMQEFCRETLRDLGYHEVRTKKELLDKSTTLVGKLPRQKLA